MGKRRAIGVTGLLLTAVLCVAPPVTALARELSVEELTELERLLAELNFDPGAIDGVVDVRTRTAVGLYQEFAALPVDGKPSATLLAELRQVVQVVSEMRAAKTLTESESAPLAAPEKAPAVAQAPQPAEPAPAPAPETASEPESAAVEAAPEAPGSELPTPEAASEPESPDLSAEPETASEPESPDLPAEPETASKPESPDLPETAAPDGRVALAPVSEAPKETAPEEKAGAAAEPEANSAGSTEPTGKEANAPPPGKADSRFDLDGMIARLVQPDRGTTGLTEDRPDSGVVRAVQRQLARIGFDPGRSDGRLGARTTQAIKDYQHARDLRADGRPTRELLVRLKQERSGQAAPAGEGAADWTPQAGTGAPNGEATGPKRTRPGLELPASGMAIRDGYDAFKKGYAAVQAGDFDLAIDLYTRAIKAGDLSLEHLADAFYNRGTARSYKGAHDYAIADYSAAILNKPDFPSAHYNRGFAFEASGQHTRALADFMRARAFGMQRLGARSPDIPPQ